MAVDQKPDLSGEWVLNRLASALSPQASAIRAGTLRFEHQDPLLRCAATFAAAEGEPITFQFERQSDGRETTDELGGNTITSNLHWEGITLVSTFLITGPGFQMNMFWRFELLDGERCLRAVEQIRGAGRDQDNEWVFDRKSAGEP